MKIMVKIIDGSLMLVQPQLVGYDKDGGGLFCDTGDFTFLMPMSEPEAKESLYSLLSNDVLDLSHYECIPVSDEDDDDPFVPV